MNALSRIALCCWLGAGLLSAEASDDVRTSREPINYDARWRVHHVEPGIPRPGGDEGERTRRPTAPSRSGLLEGRRDPTPSAPSYTPPQRRDRPSDDADRRRRNWIVPTLEDDTPWRSRDEEPEPSGWGWLADDVEQQRRERDEEQRDAERQAEEEGNVLRLREELRSGVVTGDALEASPFLFGAAEDDDEDSAAGLPPLFRDENNALDERVGSHEDNRNAMRTDDDPYLSPDPWGEQEGERASPWDADRAESDDDGWIRNIAATFDVDADNQTVSRESPLAPNFQSWNEAIGSADTAPRFATVSGRDSDVSSFGTSRSADSVGRFETSFGAIEPGTSVGSFESDGNRFAPSMGHDTGWSANWSGDSGWQGSVSTPARTPTLDSPTSSPGGALHDDGWLSDPQR